MITSDQWDFVRKSAAECGQVSGWLAGVFEMECERISSSILLDMKTKTLDESYIDFIRQQMRLNARGQEWLTILERRKASLEPWVGREVATVSIIDQSAHPHKVAWVHFSPSDKKILLVEEA